MFKYWGGEYTIWLNHIRWGFNICMGMETHVNAVIQNYGNMGFGFDMDSSGLHYYNLVFVVAQAQGLAHVGLVIQLGCLRFGLGLCRVKTRRRLLVLTKICFVGLVTTLDVYLFACNRSIPLIMVLLGCFAGAKGWRRAA